MIGSLLQPELVELIRQRNFNQLRAILCDFPAPDIAEILGDLSADDKAVLLRILPHDLATEVFEYLSVEDQEHLVQALGNEHVARILNEMPPDDRTALLEELPSAATLKLLNLLSPAARKIAADLLGYPKDSIGRRMTPEYISIQQNAMGYFENELEKAAVLALFLPLILSSGGNSGSQATSLIIRRHGRSRCELAGLVEGIAA